MDIDRLVRRVSEQVTARPSRRGLVSVLAVGPGAVVANLRGPSGVAVAQLSGSCCTGDPCQNVNRCDFRTKKGYSWFCTNAAGERYFCQDCFIEGQFVCNYGRRR
jgi:hypothetical protein